MAHKLSSMPGRTSTSTIPNYFGSQADEGSISPLSSKHSSLNERPRSARIQKSIWMDSDSDDDLENGDMDLAKMGEHYATIIDGTEKFESFEALLQVDRVRTRSFYRSCLNIKGGSLIKEFPIPWPVLKARAQSIFKNKKNIFFTLDGVFIHWTPMIVHESTEILASVIDLRGAGKPSAVCSVSFPSKDIHFTAMGLGTSVHISDLKRVRMSVGLKKEIAQPGVKFASVDVSFHISIANKAGLNTHSIITPIIIPPGVKDLVKDFRKVAERLRASNAKLIKKKLDEEEHENLKEAAGCGTRPVGPSVIKERLKAHHGRTAQRGVPIHEPLDD